MNGTHKVHDPLEPPNFDAVLRRQGKTVGLQRFSDMRNDQFVLVNFLGRRAKFALHRLVFPRGGSSRARTGNRFCSKPVRFVREEKLW